VRGICTPGSAWGDENKRPCPLGETPTRKRLRRKAPHRLPSSRLVSTILFDLWGEVWRKKVAKGDVIVVRYADGTPVQTST
jgi:hypothetical protein